MVPVDGTTTVTIPPGETQGFALAYILDDALNEATERFRVHAVAAVGAEIVGGDGVVTILDDDPQPLVGVGDAVASEADGVVRVPVVMPPSGREVSFEYRTHHGTARSGADFERTKGRVTMRAGEMLAWITIPVVDDRAREASESFTVELRNVRHAAGVPSRRNGHDRGRRLSVGEAVQLVGSSPVAARTRSIVDAAIASAFAAPTARSRASSAGSAASSS